MALEKGLRSVSAKRAAARRINEGATALESAREAADQIMLLGGDVEEACIAAGAACLDSGLLVIGAADTAGDIALEHGATKREAGLWAAEVVLLAGGSADEAGGAAMATVVKQGGDLDLAMDVASEARERASSRHAVMSLREPRPSSISPSSPPLPLLSSVLVL